MDADGKPRRPKTTSNEGYFGAAKKYFTACPRGDIIRRLLAGDAVASMIIHPRASFIFILASFFPKMKLAGIFAGFTPRNLEKFLNCALFPHHRGVGLLKKRGGQGG
jgi:hypothetical protein